MDSMNLDNSNSQNDAKTIATTSIPVSPNENEQVSSSQNERKETKGKLPPIPDCYQEAIGDEINLPFTRETYTKLTPTFLVHTAMSKTLGTVVNQFLE